MSGLGARTSSVTRPAGIPRGVGAFVVAWAGAAMIAVLTGATGVVILLAISAVAALAGLMSGPIALRGVRVGDVHTATVATAGDELVWMVEATVPRPVHAVLTVNGTKVATGWLHDGSTPLTGSAPHRGVFDRVDVAWSTAGLLGLCWWRRRAVRETPTLFVGPAPAAEPAPALRADDLEGTVDASARAGHDDVDGVRQWRDGDEVSAVHWPSTLRVGEFVVRQRQRDHDERWVVAARSSTGDSDDEAARVRRALDDCMSRGARASVRLDDGPAVELESAAAVVQWTAAFEPTLHAKGHVSFWRRELGRRGAGPEPDSSLGTGARWAVAAAAIAPLAMLLQPLGYGPAPLAVVVAAVALGALTTTRTAEDRRTLRQALGLAVGAAVAVTLVDISAITDVLSAMRYLMPQLLVTLCVVQGFECTDRRGARVAIACSGLLTAYAAGVRVDGALAGFMFTACAMLAIASQAVTRADRRHPGRTVGSSDEPEERHVRGTLARVAGAAVAAAAVVGVLAVVPVPKGPAQLTLPTWLQERRPVSSPGDLATVTGSPLLGGAVQGGGSRTGAGPGGYPGFSSTMDTTLRGDLGDQVVMRVRAPAAAFWRGQTFSQFDGRVWTVDQYPGLEPTGGPDHVIRPADGDLSGRRAADFIQTFYLAVDMPNILFAADRPTRVLLDAGVYARPDGALRSDVVLPAGSAYTVMSSRAMATSSTLHADGDISRYTVPAKYLQVPPSTSSRTRALARQLGATAADSYGAVLAIEQWLADHVGYDLDAPVPPDGADAVDHFLFDSKRGFCEQIATATAIMLRTLGIPARIATGYVPSERDEVAGVWISRARDAHAWVEVWFPSAGWVAFDPTASVPLAGDAPVHSIGGELVSALTRLVGDHLPSIIGVLATLAIAVLAGRMVRGWWRRRRRGRWGVLQDRFVAAALNRGATPHAPNASLADSFDDDRADLVARTLDECAFSPGWQDDDDRYERTAAVVAVLERSG